MNRAGPSGPPAYRPRAKEIRRASPPVYRPVPPLQAKLAPGHPKRQGGGAPPVYRPQPTAIARSIPAVRSGTSPLVSRPNASVQARMGIAGSQAWKPGTAPPVYRPLVQPVQARAVLQRSAAPQWIQPISRVIQRVRTYAVKEQRSQNLQDPGASSATKYDWESSFVIYLYGLDPDEVPEVKVIVYLQTAADDPTFANWAGQVANTWSGKFAITDGDGKRFPISVELARATPSYKDYTIEVVGSAKALGPRGYFGTESMTKWGAHDPQDIPHEVGHMLGNKDEYGTVDGEDFGSASNQLVSSDIKNVMRRGNQPVRERHFELIRDKIVGQNVLPLPVKLSKVVGSAGPSLLAAVSSPGTGASASPAVIKVSSAPVSSPASKPVAKSSPVAASSSPGQVSKPVAKSSPVAASSSPGQVSKPVAKPSPVAASSSPGQVSSPVSKSGSKAAASPLVVSSAAGHNRRQEKIMAHVTKMISTNTLTSEMEAVTNRYPDWWNNPEHSLKVLEEFGI